MNPNQTNLSTPKPSYIVNFMKIVVAVSEIKIIYTRIAPSKVLDRCSYTTFNAFLKQKVYHIN